MIDIFMNICLCISFGVCLSIVLIFIVYTFSTEVINCWRKYPKRKPKFNGWYQCTVKHGFGVHKPRVMDLYFHDGHWVDRRRKQVFEGYKVYKSCRAAIEDNRVWNDELCDREDVIAWRRLPNVYKK